MTRKELEKEYVDSYRSTEGCFSIMIYILLLITAIILIIAIVCEKQDPQCPECKTYTLHNGHVRSAILTDSCEYQEGIVELTSDSVTFVTICQD